MRISDLVAGAGAWLQGTGPENDIVISTRVRLARNLAGMPFLSRMEDGQEAEGERLIAATIAKADLPQKLTYFVLADISPLDRRLLVERHLISPELADSDWQCGVALSDDETISIMVNEEDHLRSQVIRSGLSLAEAYGEADQIDDSLEEHLHFAFSARLGYLTACPTNVGTALRASVMLHLPALVVTRQIERVFQASAKMRLAVRGLYGEGTQASGDFYQISNQVTLGRSESDILETLKTVISEIINYERAARNTLLQQGEKFIEDKIFRALATLRACRMIPSEEMMMLLSAVRMGINMGRIPDIDIKTVNEMFILTQPAHLQEMHGKELSESERDVFRAEYIRNRLAT